MGSFNRGYRLKAAGFLLLMGALVAVLFFGPALRKRPELESPVDLPSMTNLPPEGTLRVETP